MPRRKRFFGAGEGSQSRRRRQTSSLTQAICRPAVETASIERVGVGEVQRCRHLILVLQEELVVLALGQAVQLDADVGEKCRGTVQRVQVRVVGQERSEDRDGAQHADVAQPAVALLEVGLEKERHVARRGAPFGHLHLQQGEVPRAEPVAPGGARLLEERIRHLRLPPDEAAVEEPERDAHVLGGHTEHLGGAADGVVEVHALVPHRVPDGVGDLPDVPVPGVDEHDVEVTEGAQGAPAVPPDGDEGQVPLDVARGPFGQAGQPGVRLGCVPPAEFLAPQPWLRQQAAASLTQ